MKRTQSFPACLPPQGAHRKRLLSTRINHKRKFSFVGWAEKWIDSDSFFQEIKLFVKSLIDLWGWVYVVIVVGNNNIAWQWLRGAEEEFSRVALRLNDVTSVGKFEGSSRTARCGLSCHCEEGQVVHLIEKLWEVRLWALIEDSSELSSCAIKAQELLELFVFLSISWPLGETNWLSFQSIRVLQGV